ncbi:MAG TPA: hydrogenase maturation nickel metallochaperone HypA [Burkholderiaceae bacterium]|nr:hydrogenase maturation nickel metallochaperone HypA [Burkholderiaceae bacterium]
MHEMSLAEGIVQIVETTARANDARAVRAVWLALGALSHVEHESLRFSFDVVKHGTVAHDARLEIEITPGRAWCMPCAESVDLARLGDACPRCGSHQLQVTQGEEMRVKEIEIA